MLGGASRDIVPRLNCGGGEASDVCSKLGAASILPEARVSACVTACARHVAADTAGNRKMARDVTTIDSSEVVAQFPIPAGPQSHGESASVIRCCSATTGGDTTDAQVRWLLCPSM